MVRMLVALCVLAAVQTYATAEGAKPESIAWCNGDSECLLKSATLIPLFAKERGMTEAELRDKLNNCEGFPVSNLGFCGWYSQFGAEVDLKEHVQRLISKSTKTCATKIVAGQRQWRRKVEKRCEEHAKIETNNQWGAYGDELMASCLKKSNDQRSHKLKAIATCSPCSLCL